jgi:hypothetical protein
VSSQDLEMVKWLSRKFQGCTITSNVVAILCGAGAIDILQFFYEHDRRVVADNCDADSDVTTACHAVGGEGGRWRLPFRAIAVMLCDG